MKAICKNCKYWTQPSTFSEQRKIGEGNGVCTGILSHVDSLINVFKADGERLRIGSGVAISHARAFCVNHEFDE